MANNKKEIVFYEDKVIKKEDVNYIYVTNFNDDGLQKFYEKFTELNTNPKVKLIPIVISSYGGQVHSLLGMLDIMKSANKPVATIALGKAMSCGAVLLSAGTRGYRYAGDHCQILIHEVSSAAWGKSADIQEDAAQTKKLNKLLMGMLAKNARKKADFFLSMSKKKSNVDLTFSSAESKNIGLIDFVSVPNFIKS